MLLYKNNKTPFFPFIARNSMGLALQPQVETNPSMTKTKDIHPCRQLWTAVTKTGHLISWRSWSNKN